MSHANYRPLALLVGAAFFMEQFDSTVIAPAIPQIASAFNVDPLSLNLTMTVYLLCNVAVIPLSGLLTARFGTRTVFKTAVALFTLSSLLCGFADGIGILICARALQGASAALMVPVGRTAIVHTTNKSDLVMALAWMITPAMLGPLLGPPLGALVVTYASWHWIFFINLPIGIIGYVAANRIVPQIVEAEPTGQMIRQWVPLAAMLLAMASALELVRHKGIDPKIYALLLITLLISSWVYRRQRRAGAAPLLDFALLRERTFTVSFWGGSLVRVGYGTLPFLLPLMLQLGLGFSAIQSGLVLLANGAVALVTKTFTSRILAHYGFRTVLIVNGALCALALALCATFRANWSVAALATAASMGGVFRAVQLNALAAIAYADLPPNKVAAGTALNTTFQQLAVMFGISLSVSAIDLSARVADRATPGVADFSLAFVILALFVLAAVPVSFGLSPTAGRELSGHRVHRAAE